MSAEVQKRFSSETEANLRAAGWTPGRTLPDEELEKWYVIPWGNNVGYSIIFPAALRVLREFGGLKIESLEKTDDIPDDAILFEPLNSIGSINPISIGWDLDDVVFPIGEYFCQGDSYDIVVVNTKGQVFLVNIMYILLGNSIEEALETISLSIRDEEKQQINIPPGPDSVKVQEGIVRYFEQFSNQINAE